MNNTLPVSPNTVNREYSLLAAFEQFRLGWDYFTAKHDVSVCTNVQQRRGWWSALEAEAAATLPANCADRLGF